MLKECINLVFRRVYVTFCDIFLGIIVITATPTSHTTR